jgi:hypothetical protein
MWPNLLESAISVRPRARDWMFSSVMSGARPAKAGASMPAKAFMAGSIETVSQTMPSRRATSAASSRLSRLV